MARSSVAGAGRRPPAFATPRDRPAAADDLRPPRIPPDTALVGTVALLVAIGVIMIFSASSATAAAMHGDGAYYFKRELVWLALGAPVAYLAYRLDYRLLRRLAPVVLVAGLLLQAAVLVPHLGLAAGDSRRWLGTSAFSFEPAEFTKLAVIVYLSAAIATMGDRIRVFSSGLFPLALVVLVFAMLIVKEPDLGTASIVTFVGFALLYAGRARIVHLLMIAAVTVPVGAFVVWHDAAKRARIFAFVHPWDDPQNKGYQITQSLMAIGSGGPFGLGLGFSRQKFFFLPEHFTDFIFAILGEEIGLVGGSLVLLLFVVFAYRATRIALHARDRFGFFLATGCTSLIVIQALINIGVVSSSWPTTGVPLPFISFGGSSLVVSLVAVGLILNVGKYRAVPGSVP